MTTNYDLHGHDVQYFHTAVGETIIDILDAMKEWFYTSKAWPSNVIIFDDGEDLFAHVEHSGTITGGYEKKIRPPSLESFTDEQLLDEIRDRIQS